MLSNLSAFSRTYRHQLVFMSMILSSVLCSSLLVLRFFYTHTFTYLFLIWNLFLAWLPVVFAFTAYSLHQKSGRLSRSLVAVCGVIWLVFLPNAPYLMTDLIHLKPRTEMSFWFDLTMFIAFALTGLLYGLVSLYWMQALVRKTAGVVASWLFVIGVLGLCGFGIYLGRFLNWNSWDVVANPTSLLFDIWQRIRHPVAHFETFAFSGLFSLFLVVAYSMLRVITQLREES